MTLRLMGDKNHLFNPFLVCLPYPVSTLSGSPGTVWLEGVQGRLMWQSPGRYQAPRLPTWHHGLAQSTF